MYLGHVHEESDDSDTPDHVTLAIAAAAGASSSGGRQQESEGFFSLQPEPQRYDR